MSALTRETDELQNLAEKKEQEADAALQSLIDLGPRPTGENGKIWDQKMEALKKEISILTNEASYLGTAAVSKSLREPRIYQLRQAGIVPTVRVHEILVSPLPSGQYWDIGE